MCWIKPEIGLRAIYNATSKCFLASDLLSGLIWKDRYIAELVCFAPALISTGSRMPNLFPRTPHTQRKLNLPCAQVAQHPAINHLEL